MSTSTAAVKASTDETITVTAARELPDKHLVFAGIRLPTLAVSLAQETTSPRLEVIDESGVTGAHPSHPPATIADSVLITDAEGVLTLPALFRYVLQGGRIDVADDLQTIPAPSAAEVATLRTEIDPQGVYLR